MLCPYNVCGGRTHNTGDRNRDEASPRNEKRETRNTPAEAVPTMKTSSAVQTPYWKMSCPHSEMNDEV